MKRFLLRTLLYLLPFVALLVYYFFIADWSAMEGDLGRMTSTEFHYTHPQILPLPPMAECRNVESVPDIAALADDEMVVFGDSFSIGDSLRWHQFMGAALSKRIVFAGRFYKPADDLLDALLHHPGLLGDTVVLELVERNLVSLALLQFPQENPSHTNPAAAAAGATQRKEGPLDILKGKWRRKSRKPIQFYQHRLGIDVPVGVERLDGNYFSCRPDRLYYYEDDLHSNLSSEQAAAALANWHRLDSLAGTQGITLFLVAIPDKYTVYHRHLAAPRHSGERLLEAPCPLEALPRFVNTLPLITSLVASGTPDVYLPDDSHFSTPTALAVGNFVASVLMP